MQHFVEKFSRQMKKEIRGLNPEAMQKLMLHSWPGNVRELENTIEYAVAMAPQEIITGDLILQQRDIPTENGVRPLKEAREDFEKGYLVKLLEFTSGNVSKAAEVAGRYRADLYNLLRKYRISPDDFKKG
ncbi:MAG: hypothetical protein M0Q43_04030 [Methanothrix sp.]|nr:hypothetical protein [Methanothrix sp.]